MGGGTGNTKGRGKACGVRGNGFWMERPRGGLGFGSRLKQIWVGCEIGLHVGQAKECLGECFYLGGGKDGAARVFHDVVTELLIGHAVGAAGGAPFSFDTGGGEDEDGLEVRIEAVGQGFGPLLDRHDAADKLADVGFVEGAGVEEEFALSIGGNDASPVLGFENIDSGRANNDMVEVTEGGGEVVDDMKSIGKLGQDVSDNDFTGRSFAAVDAVPLQSIEFLEGPFSDQPHD